MQTHVVVFNNMNNELKIMKLDYPLFLIRNSIGFATNGRRSRSTNSGFMALSSLLLISVVTLGIVLSVSLLGVSESRSSLDYKKGLEVLSIAEGCMDEALLRIKDTTNYQGGSLNVGSGECTINIVGADENRTITVQAQITQDPGYTREIVADVITRNGAVLITDFTRIK